MQTVSSASGSCTPTGSAPHPTCVERYAKDEQAFFSEFAVAFAKLLALGTAEKCPFAKAEVDHSAEFREQAMHGSLAKVTELAAKADVKATEAGSDRTALHKAAFWGHDHLMPILIDHCGIDVNAVDYNGDTAAHDAAKFGHVKVVEALIAAKASLESLPHPPPTHARALRYFPRGPSGWLCTVDTPRRTNGHANEARAAPSAT